MGKALGAAMRSIVPMWARAERVIVSSWPT
jgi:hypothetical protein